MELWNNVFDLLLIQDILSLGWTSMRMKVLKEAYCRFSFSLRRVIMPFFNVDSNIIDFANMMEQTNAVISGSTALQFFERTIYPNSDLDPYFEVKHVKLWKTLVVEFGYKLLLMKDKTSTESVIKHEKVGYPSFEEIETLESFQRKVTKKVIQLMGMKGSPIQAILDFHSSE